ncbi:MAG: bifunctional folylpolyglutamate synthase/dihydrofolate synthase [Clostridia bacterium]|nr:bifunctional folylpolyglutamate synthase/dihydrofolate synthase [Clostridia bacterium]
MTYEETLKYIHTISWEFCKPGLERISKLCKGLNNPEKELKFIHVAGTNGKGSFCSMLQSVLTGAGYKTGLYTSPYILSFNERMSIDGNDITNEELISVTERVKKIADKMEEKPTEFELVTAIALEYFKVNKCDYVVLECGLGGRLDSTNVVTNTILSVITGISLDHTSILGDTVEKIAYEKAGIIKENTPVLYCGEDKKALCEIEKVAKINHSPMYFPSHNEIKIKKMDLSSTIFDYSSYKSVEINLLGSYQPINASNVLTAIEILKNYGLSIPENAVYEGLKNAKWHARFERISTTPCLIFDGAHNPEGVLASVESIKKYFGDERSYIITGVMADKDYNFMAKAISQVAEKVFCLTPDNKRALSADEYASVYNSLGVEAYGYLTVEDAVVNAINEAKKSGKSIFCLGSLYMYAELLPIVKKLTNSTNF